MKNIPLRFLISHSKPSHMEEIYNELTEISREYIEILQDGQIIFLRSVNSDGGSVRREE